ncbi:DUF4817 domain-containing protein [Trichonephila clavipes]|nr:DUF4817 domain-containing protein [Trichonephila clavipes]
MGKKYRTWTVNDRKKVIFSDEIHLFVRRVSGRAPQVLSGYTGTAIGGKKLFLIGNFGAVDSWLVCHKFEPSTTEDSPCRGAVVPTRRRNTALATIDLLKDTFGDRLISRFGPVNWPPRSCDLTPLDYFLWGYVKSLVYADKSQTLDHLEDNIRRVIAAIRPQMLEKVIENWTSRLDYIRASRGSPMPEIIFKM